MVLPVNRPLDTAESCHPPRQGAGRYRGPRRQPLGGAVSFPFPGGGETEYPPRRLKFVEQRDSLAGAPAPPRSPARPPRATHRLGHMPIQGGPQCPPTAPLHPPLPACGCLSWSPAVNPHEFRDAARHQTFSRTQGLGLGLGHRHRPGPSFRACVLRPHRTSQVSHWVSPSQTVVLALRSWVPDSEHPRD